MFQRESIFCNKISSWVSLFIEKLVLGGTNFGGSIFTMTDPHFVDKFLASIYVDDLVTGSTDVNSAFEFYKKSRQRLAVAGLRLRRFITNSEELRCLIQQNESQSEDGGAIQP